MTITEMAYEMLTTIRASFIVDDERIDLRLIESAIKRYRKDYIDDIAKGSQKAPEALRQHTSFDTTAVDYGEFKRVETTDKIPRISVNKFGPMIEEIYSSYVDEYPFTVVNRTALRYSGNGKFNQGIIYVAYDNDKLYFNSKDIGYKLMNKVSVAAVFSEPEDVPGFDIETDEYPLDLDGVNYAYEQFRDNELKLLLLDRSDEVSNSDGNIE